MYSVTCAAECHERADYCLHCGERAYLLDRRLSIVLEDGRYVCASCKQPARGLCQGDAAELWGNPDACDDFDLALKIMRLGFADLSNAKHSINALKRLAELQPRAETLTPEPRPIAWRWTNWLAEGSMAILAGNPGAGKSMVALDWARRVACGLPFVPGDVTAPPKRIIFIGDEDDVNVLSSRMLALSGLQESRIARVDFDHRMYLKLAGFGGERFSFARHTKQLEEFIANLDTLSDFPVGMVIVDPLNSYMGIDTDDYSYVKVRTILDPLLDFLHRTGIILVGVMHLNKKEDRSAIYRASGSQAYVAAARAFIMLERDGNQRTLRMVKNNYGEIPLPLYVNFGNGISYNSMRWPS